MRFQPAVRAVARLARHDRYLGALIFGSVADGTAGEASDLDVRVVVAEDNSCDAINHPKVGGIKLDITFASLAQLERQLAQELAERRRPPMLAGSLVVFDKTAGELETLRQRATGAEAPAYDPAAAKFDQFMLYHANDKVERALVSDPASSLWSMHATVNDVLNIHYRVRGRYKVSSKKLLADLERWDPPLAGLLREFVATGEAQQKFVLWSAIIDHVNVGLGGRLPIEENVCDCEVCRADIGALLSVERS